MTKYSPPRDEGLNGFGYSSQTMFSPGLDSTEIDHMVLRPHTSWRGVRGVRTNFGRLYASTGHHELQPASGADPGTLLGRSGQSGYRGGRPTFGSSDEGGELPRFGAKLEIKNVGTYEGNDTEAFLLSLGVLAIAAKMVGVF